VEPKGDLAAVATTAGFALLGGAVGLAVTWTSAYRPSSAWAVWALVATAMTTSAGAAAAYGLRRWRLLGQFGKVTVRAVVGPIAGMWLTALAFGAVYQAVHLSSSGRWQWRAGLLVLTVGIGVLPAIATIVAGGIAAAHLPDADPGTQYRDLIQIRRILLGLLVALGGMIALLVVSATTSQRLTGGASTVEGLLFGGFMSALLAIIYLPAAARLRDRGARLVDQALPMPGLTGTQLAERAEQRAKLEASLGVDKSIFSDLQTNLVVLGPLIASAAAALLSGQIT
jgi:hypothetical protein